MIAGKKQEDIARFLAEDYWYESARLAMEDFIQVVAKQSVSQAPLHVFVPSYIGLSPKEGSGIYDPICRLRDKGLILDAFYKMTDELFIDFESLKQQIECLGGAPFLVLRVNYFGFVDPCAKELFKYVKETGGILLEDDAHAFFSYLYQQELLSHAAFFSLHKQFPFGRGGMLRLNSAEFFGSHYAGRLSPENDLNPWRYNLSLISQKYRENFLLCEEYSRRHPGQWSPLRTLDPYSTIVPQTYPVLLSNADRFEVYLKMNEMGYGVTSLYHTMIEPLQGKEGEYPSTAVAKTILNIPTHPDVGAEELSELLDVLYDVCVEMSH